MPQHLNGFLVALKAFASLEDSCFSTELDPYYQDRINDFAEAYKALNLRITPKVVDKKISLEIIHDVVLIMSQMLIIWIRTKYDRSNIDQRCTLACT